MTPFPLAKHSGSFFALRLSVLGDAQPMGPAKAARADLQSVYDKVLRRVCGVNRATPSAMLLEKLALSPLQTFGGDRHSSSETQC